VLALTLTDPLQKPPSYYLCGPYPHPVWTIPNGEGPPSPPLQGLFFLLPESSPLMVGLLTTWLGTHQDLDQLRTLPSWAWWPKRALPTLNTQCPPADKRPHPPTGFVPITGPTWQ
jgi:hypothetical protein